MWIRVTCTVCGLANLLPEKQPGHVETCAECDRPFPVTRAGAANPAPLAPMPSPFMAKAPRKQTGKAGMFVAFFALSCVVFGAGVAVGVFVVAPKWRDEPRPGRPEPAGPDPMPQAVTTPDIVPPTEQQPKEISWQTHRDERGGFLVEYPEQIAGPMSSLPSIEKDKGRVHGAGPGGVSWDVRHESYSINFTETQLLYWAGLDSRGKDSLTRKDIRLGAHPGFEHTAPGMPGGEQRPIRSRVFAVGNRIYEVTVLFDPKSPGPAGWEERFLDSFRLLAEPAGVFAEVFAEDRQPIWRESWSVAGNYSVAMPGRATELKARTPGSDKELDVTSRTVDAGGTEFVIRSVFHSGPLNAAELLEEVGVKELAGFAIEKRAVKHGTHPGIEFTAARTTDGRARAVRSKVISAGGRLLQLSVISDSAAKTPDSLVARFFDSFRLANDPATAGKDPFAARVGGWRSCKNVEWNFAADFPGILHTSAPKQVLDNSAAWEASSVDQASRASFAVTVIRYREDLSGAELLDRMGTKRMTTPAGTKTPVKLGDHPGMEFFTTTTDNGRETEQRTRVFAVGGWLYELRLTGRGSKIPEETAARFFDSFRLPDPAGRPTPGEAAMKKPPGQIPRP